MRKLVEKLKVVRRFVRKFVEKLWEKDILRLQEICDTWAIGKQNVRVAMREGAAAGTCIGTTALAIDLFCCFAYLMSNIAAKQGVYGPLDDPMIICQMLIFAGNVVVGLIFAFAYVRHDRGGRTEIRTLWTGNGTQDVLLWKARQKVKMIFASTGVLLSIMFVIITTLPVMHGVVPKIPGVILEFLVLVSLVILIGKVRDILWEINAMYSEGEQQRIRARRGWRE